MHSGTSHIGTTCPECGTEHRVIESIPARPVSRDLLNDLEETDEITFAEGISWFFGEIAGTGTDEEVTEDIVLATDSEAMLLSLYEPGWVVEMEEEPGGDETIEERAKEMWVTASGELSDALHEFMGEDRG